MSSSLSFSRNNHGQMHSPISSAASSSALHSPASVSTSSLNFISANSARNESIENRFGAVDPPKMTSSRLIPPLPPRSALSKLPYLTYASSFLVKNSIQKWLDAFSTSEQDPQYEQIPNSNNVAAYNQYLAAKYFRKWRSIVAQRKVKYGVPWLLQKLLAAPEEEERIAAAKIIMSFCENNTNQFFIFLDQLVHMMKYTVEPLQDCKIFFILFNIFTKTEEIKLYLTAKDFLTCLTDLIFQSTVEIFKLENKLAPHPQIGANTKLLTSLLLEFLTVPNIKRHFKSAGFLSQTLKAFLNIKSLVVCQTHHLEETSTKLLDLMDSVRSESKEAQQIFLSVCIDSIRASHAANLSNIGSSYQDGESSHGFHGFQKQKIQRNPINLVSKFIWSRLNDVVNPKKKLQHYLLNLTKFPPHEDFIPGVLRQNPYTSESVGGILMRDVKNQICRELGMEGLIADDNGMELLVAGKIVQLGLEINRVYEKVWIPSVMTQTNFDPQSPPPMVVFYRLQGLFGEATEPVVSSLPEEEIIEEDPEIKFAITRVLSRCGGIVALLAELNVFLNDFNRQQGIADSVLELLHSTLLIKDNRIAFNTIGGLDILFQKLNQIIVDKNHIEYARQLITMILGVVNEKQKVAQSASSSSSSSLMASAATSLRLQSAAASLRAGVSLTPKQSFANESKSQSEQIGPQNYPWLDAHNPQLSRVKLLIYFFQYPLVRENDDIVESIASLLPPLTQGQYEPIAFLCQQCVSASDFESIDCALHPNYRKRPRGIQVEPFQLKLFTLDVFSQMIVGLSTNTIAQTFKTQLFESGILVKCLTYLENLFPGKTLDKESTQFKDNIDMPSLPRVLGLLAGLFRFHKQCQHTIQKSPGIIPLLHRLEKLSKTKNSIGSLSEEVLNFGREMPTILREDIDAVRSAQRKVFQNAADAHRESIMKDLLADTALGMTKAGKAASSSTSDTKLSSPSSKSPKPKVPDWMLMMDEIEEEKGHACVVCQEGYTLQPNNMLAIYTFSKQIDLNRFRDSYTPSTRLGYSTVTHFHTIHVTCHQAAYKAESHRNPPPKHQWQGASVRNGHTLCNNMFPILSPTIHTGIYESQCNSYFSTLNSQCGSISSPQFRTIVHDLNQLIYHFAFNESFSLDSKGGTATHNIRFIPYLLQFGFYILDSTKYNQRSQFTTQFSQFISKESSSFWPSARKTSSSSSKSTTVSSTSSTSTSASPSSSSTPLSSSAPSPLSTPLPQDPLDAPQYFNKLFPQYKGWSNGDITADNAMYFMTMSLFFTDYSQWKGFLKKFVVTCFTDYLWHTAYVMQKISIANSSKRTKYSQNNGLLSIESIIFSSVEEFFLPILVFAAFIDLIHKYLETFKVPPSTITILQSSSSTSKPVCAKGLLKILVDQHYDISEHFGTTIYKEYTLLLQKSFGELLVILGLEKQLFDSFTLQSTDIHSKVEEFFPLFLAQYP